MSNLLSANVDAGLKYSLSMGYHEDTRTRTAFMQVLTNILNQGTEFETLAETALTDRYEKLVDVSIAFFQYSMTTAFCDDISETDVLCTIDDCGCRFDHCHVLMRCLPNV
jgi:neurofibromin 1